MAVTGMLALAAIACVVAALAGTGDQS